MVKSLQYPKLVGKRFLFLDDGRMIGTWDSEQKIGIIGHDDVIGDDQFQKVKKNSSRVKIRKLNGEYQQTDYSCCGYSFMEKIEEQVYLSMRFCPCCGARVVDLDVLREKEPKNE